MEEEWIVDRCKLREVWFEHPEWSRKEMGNVVGRSESWVKKWLQSIRSAPLEDREILNSRSRIRKRLPPRLAPEVVNKILSIRDHPPQQLGRTPEPVLATWLSVQIDGVKLISLSHEWTLVDNFIDF